MIVEGLAIAAAVLAGIPALLTGVNLLLYRAPRPAGREEAAAASLLIPARDEAANIASCLQAAATAAGPGDEILVVDDGSEDETAAIVSRLAREDPRIRLLHAPPLPEGWCGKPHACQALADAADREVLIFLDADVRLAPGSVPRLVRALQEREAALLSGVPRQVLGTPGERLLVPLIHFVLLGFLPMLGMRLSRRAAFGAGCGQLFVARCDAYRAVGGHRRTRASRHDGLTLPRAFRQEGYYTDLVDATDLANCRMYRGAREVWNGLAKNATEGMASRAGLVPWTLLLLGGQVAPWLLLPAAWGSSGLALGAAASAAALTLATRSLLSIRFRHPWDSVLLHPVGVTLLVAIQWYARARALTGRTIAWKGRTA
jgi:hypothetical protein